jgi:hypothetical protein
MLFAISTFSICLKKLSISIFIERYFNQLDDGHFFFLGCVVYYSNKVLARVISAMVPVFRAFSLAINFPL